MKKIILITLLTLVCLIMKAQPKPIRLTVAYVHREAGSKEVWAKSKRYWYMSVCPTLPDSVRVGTVLKADPYKGQGDCACLFRRMRR